MGLATVQVVKSLYKNPPLARTHVPRVFVAFGLLLFFNLLLFYDTFLLSLFGSLKSVHVHCSVLHQSSLAKIAQELQNQNVCSMSVEI